MRLRVGRDGGEPCSAVVAARPAAVLMAHVRRPGLWGDIITHSPWPSSCPLLSTCTATYTWQFAVHTPHQTGPWRHLLGPFKCQ